MMGRLFAREMSILLSRQQRPSTSPGIPSINSVFAHEVLLAQSSLKSAPSPLHLPRTLRCLRRPSRVSSIHKLTPSVIFVAESSAKIL